ncbi:MAG: hypothetical protein MSA07_07735 [Mucispirillum sp.]|uniref:PH domain-containing protein n=1 Tax=Candidatus Mucispirillum faecigallinarum TaxID=2838699 RepID=A0A9D2GWD2_9BACT|nr:hypothetical protein [Mucispirillum sp.]HIZ90240.1 hypothetical protein [Candidatus Mucispirillum faecigallinarum]
MKNFRTNKTFIALHVIIFTLLIIFALNSENRTTQLNIILLSAMVVISLFMLTSSLIKSVTITDDKIIVRSILKTTTLDINNISYGYALSAMGRFVLIVNDGNRSIMVSSLNDGFENLVSLVSSKITDEERKAFDIITPASLKRKYMIYAFVMTLIVALLVYGIITSYHLV